ncbi:MAG: methylmalonyl-CoA epimerase [bacterium]|nr:methylmalonyl-CoA epimerase [bacterium]
MTTPEILSGLVRDLHHVAVAVERLEEARLLYEGALGMRASGDVEFVPGQKVNVLVLFAGTQRVELVEPASEDSPISGFLAKRGGGIHHVAWRVDDVQAAIDALLARGVRMIHTTAQPGSHGTSVAFVHPKATGGVLMELVQDAAPAR